MSVFLFRLAEVVAGVVVIDGLIVGFLALSHLAGVLWNRLHRRQIDATDHWIAWEAELRTTAMRRHPAGGSQ